MTVPYVGPSLDPGPLRKRAWARWAVAASLDRHLIARFFLRLTRTPWRWAP